jgi:hypothetical protein
MAVSFARLQGMIQTAADSASNLLQKIILGTPGSAAMFPSGDPIDEHVARPQDTGQLWSGELVPPILTQLGIELDSAMVAWALIDTRGTGLSVDIRAGRHVASATKNEVNNTLTINLDPAYTSANYVGVARVWNEHFIDRMGTQIAASCSFSFYNTVSALQTINDRLVMFLACGQV